MEDNIQDEEFSTTFNDSLIKKHVNPFTMEQLELYKPHIVNFAKKCRTQNMYEIDHYGNHLLKIYDHINLENLVVIFQTDKDIYQKYIQQIQKEQRQREMTLTEEELKKLNEGIKDLYDD